MEFLDDLREILLRNPIRALLTMAGVAWGLYVLVVMLGLGDGLHRATLAGLGPQTANTVSLWGGRSSLPWAGYQPGRPVRFRMADAEALRTLPGVLAVAARNQLGGWRDGNVVTHGDRLANLQVMGDEPTLPLTTPLRLVEGRFLNPLDLTERRKVAVIGSQVVEELFADGEGVLGSDLAINGIHLTVVGVVTPPYGGDRADRAASTVHVPLSTFQQVFATGDRVGWLSVVGEPEIDAAALEDRLRELLASRHGAHPDDPMAVNAWNAGEEYQRTQRLFAAIQSVVWGVGLATLASGAVGVTNILLVSLKERTREIGLRRAIGAWPSAIAWLVLREALGLVGLAGGFGLLGAVITLALVRWWVGPDHPSLAPPTLSAQASVGALLVLLATGVGAGLLPARRALAIHPVEALRAE